MTRAAILLTLGLSALGCVASAQDLRDLQARNAAAQALDDARRDLLASQIELSNANEQARSRLILRDLDSQRTGAVISPSDATPSLDAPARRALELSKSMDRLERLTQDALAASNARMRAIRPASEPR